jgi:hypothetical protein
VPRSTATLWSHRSRDTPVFGLAGPGRHGQNRALTACRRQESSEPVRNGELTPVVDLTETGCDRRIPGRGCRPVTIWTGCPRVEREVGQRGVHHLTHTDSRESLPASDGKTAEMLILTAVTDLRYSPQALIPKPTNSISTSNHLVSHGVDFLSGRSTLCSRPSVSSHLWPSGPPRKVLRWRAELTPVLGSLREVQYRSRPAGLVRHLSPGN